MFHINISAESKLPLLAFLSSFSAIYIILEFGMWSHVRLEHTINTSSNKDHAIQINDDEQVLIAFIYLY